MINKEFKTGMFRIQLHTKRTTQIFQSFPTYTLLRISTTRKHPSRRHKFCYVILCVLFVLFRFLFTKGCAQILPLCVYWYSCAISKWKLCADSAHSNENIHIFNSRLYKKNMLHWEQFNLACCAFSGTWLHTSNTCYSRKVHKISANIYRLVLVEKYCSWNIRSIILVCWFVFFSIFLCFFI